MHWGNEVGEVAGGLAVTEIFFPSLEVVETEAMVGDTTTEVEATAVPGITAGNCADVREHH